MNTDRISELFDLLDKWRYFPAYQLERRADIFFAIYLKQIIQNRFGVPIDAIIPEFPVRVGAIIDKEINKSFKIDYVCVCQDKQIVFLVELKTDMLSRREKQDWYLKRAQEINVKGLVDGLFKIYAASNQKRKYNYLFHEMENLGWIMDFEGTISSFDRMYKMEILYIQPEKHPEDASSMVITFEDIITFLKTQSDSVSKRFSESLERWKENPNQQLKVG
jgi:hypothetical protein